MDAVTGHIESTVQGRIAKGIKSDSGNGGWRSMGGFGSGLEGMGSTSDGVVRGRSADVEM